jgi:hypothetical protein
MLHSSARSLAIFPAMPAHPRSRSRLAQTVLSQLAAFSFGCISTWLGVTCQEAEAVTERQLDFCRLLRSRG